MMIHPKTIIRKYSDSFNFDWMTHHQDDHFLDDHHLGDHHQDDHLQELHDQD